MFIKVILAKFHFTIPRTNTSKKHIGILQYFHPPDLALFKKLSNPTYKQGGNCKKFFDSYKHQSTNDRLSAVDIPANL